MGNQLKNLQDKLNSLLIDRAKVKLTQCGRSFYEFGNKPGTMIAKALKQARVRNCIPQVKT